MSRTRLVLRVFLVFVLLGMIVFLGWFFFLRGGAESYIRAGEASYTAGLKALNDKDAQTALLRFEEAMLQAKRALDAVEQEAKKTASGSPDDLNRLVQMQGRAFWLKAIALRDHAYAKGMAEGKPLSASLDTSTGKTFRSVRAIPDAKIQGEAMNDLRNAAMRLTKSQRNIEVQREALRSELMSSPLNWNFARTFSRNILEIDPDNARALFMLARYDFEQPLLSKDDPYGNPVDPLKRSRQRTLDALKNLDKAMQDKDAPMWRMLDLKTKIHLWLLDDALRNRDEEQVQKQKQIVQKLLFGKDGALAKAARGAEFKNISDWDRDGALNLHLLALDMAIKKTREDEEEAKEIRRIFDSTLAFCKKAPEFSKSFEPGSVAETAVAAAKKVQPILADRNKEEWKKNLETIQELAQRAKKEKQGKPEMYAGLAALLAAASMTESRLDDKKRKEHRFANAFTWIKAGLQVAQQQKLSASRQVPLHEMAAGLNLMSRDNKSAMASHLKFLEESRNSHAATFVTLVKGVVTEREGKLGKARKFLEMVLRSPHRDLAFRARPLLVNIYLTTGAPARALALLMTMKTDFKRFKELSPQDQAWSADFMGNEEEVDALLAIAHFQTALQKEAEFRSENNGTEDKAALAEHKRLIKEHEEIAQKLLENLTPKTQADLRARQAAVRYDLQMGKLKEARQEVVMLRAEYPKSVAALQLDVLQFEVEKRQQSKAKFPTLDKQTIAVADKKIEDYLNENPKDLAAKLYWTSWLSRTNRTEKALKYLKNPAYFPEKQDKTYQAILAVVLLQIGDKEKGLAVLQQLPPNPTIDAILIQLASTLTERQQRLNKAIARYENNAIFVCWEATLLVNQGKLEEAARGFYKAIDISRVQAWARRGLMHSLMALAKQNPNKTRALATEMLKEHSTEPSLLLTYAYASLLLDDLGEPNDVWGRTKNMAAALNAWSRSPVVRELAPERIAVVKAEFWDLAGCLDVEKKEVLRALEYNPKYPRALELAVLVGLQMADPDLLKKSKEIYVKTLREVLPKSSVPWLLQGRLEERDKNNEQAIAAYEKVLEINPNDAGTRSRLIRLLEKQGNDAGAAKLIDAWLASDADSVVAVHEKIRLLSTHMQLQQAISFADKCLQRQLTKLQKELDKQKMPKGMKEADFIKRKKEFLARSEQRLEIVLAQAFAAGKAISEAKSRAEEVLNKDPKSIPAMLLLGEAYFLQKDMTHAYDVFKKVLANNDCHYQAGNNVAWMLAHDFNKPAEALAILQKLRLGHFSNEPLPAYRLKPNLLDTFGAVYCKLDRKDRYPEMLAFFRSALRNYPYDARIHFYLGRAYDKLGQTKLAIGTYDKAIKLVNDGVQLSDETRQKIIMQARHCREELVKSLSPKKAS